MQKRIEREYIDEKYFQNVAKSVKDFLKKYYEEKTKSKKQKDLFKKILDKIWVKYVLNNEDFLPNYKKRNYDEYKSSYIFLENLSIEERDLLIDIGKTPYPFSRFSQNKINEKKESVHNEYYTISYITILEDLSFLEVEPNKTYNAILTLTYHGIIYFNHILKLLEEKNITLEECPYYYYCGLKIGYYTRSEISNDTPYFKDGYGNSYYYNEKIDENEENEVIEPDNSENNNLFTDEQVEEFFKIQNSVMNLDSNNPF